MSKLKAVCTETEKRNVKLTARLDLSESKNDQYVGRRREKMREEKRREDSTFACYVLCDVCCVLCARCCILIQV